MYATTTATMISGATAIPDLDVKRRATTTDVSGSLNIATQAAPINEATACVSANPGRCEASRPPAAPRNNAGNVGPPRKLPRETLQARPLNTSRSASVDTDTVAAESKRDPKASWPENSTALTGWSVA